MKTKSLVMALVALALVGGVGWLGVGGSSAPVEAPSGQRLFPQLERRLNAVRRIRVEHDGEVYDIEKSAAQWQLPDKGGYPVLFERVKSLLLGMALLEKVEPMTRKPENYPRLGVQAPAAGAGNTRIGLYTDDGRAVASLIVGRVQAGLLSGDRDGIYARVSGEAGAWLLAGKLDLPQQAVDWVDRRIIHIKPKAVKRVTIRQPDGSRLVIEKAYRGAPGFSLVGVPDGVAPKDPAQVNALARSLAVLDMMDLRVRPSAAPPPDKTVTALFETWEGLKARVATQIDGDGRVWGWFDLSGTLTGDSGQLEKTLGGWIFRLPPARARKLRATLDDLADADPG